MIEVNVNDSIYVNCEWAISQREVVLREEFQLNWID